MSTPEGTPEYFLPKLFHLMDSNGVVKKDLTQALVEEGTRDIKEVIREKRLQAKMDDAMTNVIDVPIVEGWTL